MTQNKQSLIFGILLAAFASYACCGIANEVTCETDTECYELCVDQGGEDCDDFMAGVEQTMRSFDE